ncbi:hypothetical protein [Elioraea tepidiphila]|uniref:hypothetical protein n=1 Tax=Elioraea tepidiphila TaxID=457934 RepID=UPI002FD98BA7
MTPGEDPRDLARLPIRELRERAQQPERSRNDLGGALFGDWVSPFLTRAFLRHDVSPTVGTFGMLIAGLAGALLLPFGGGWSVAGALCFVLFYVLDCVDGEVARLRGIDRYFWSFPDFFFGAWVMALFHVSLGIYAFRFTESPWMLLAGTALALALLTKKFIDVCHVFLTVEQIVTADATKRARYATQLGVDPADAPVPPAEPAILTSRRQVIARYGGAVGVVRAALANFHLAMLCFAVLAILDLMIGPWRIAETPLDLKTLFLLLYLPLYLLHVADHFVFLWRGGFAARSAALLRRLARWNA